MRKLRWYDWLAGLAIWTSATFLLGVVMDESGAPEEVTLMTAFGLWSMGVVSARVWWIRRAGANEDGSPRVGLSTGEMTAQRLADMEARIYELEERLELTERLLAQSEARVRLPLAREDIPA